MTTPSNTTVTPTVLTPQALLEHWLGHRGLTRRVIEAFPESDLFSFSAGGMRTFAELATEALQMVAPTVRGMLDDVWEGGGYGTPGPATKADLLAAWDEADRLLADSLPRVPAERYGQVADAFGIWTAPIYTTVLYVIDNEIHHRGQGYVYLRMLGITPPAFFERPALTQPSPTGPA